MDNETFIKNGYDKLVKDNLDKVSISADSKLVYPGSSVGSDPFIFRDVERTVDVNPRINESYKDDDGKEPYHLLDEFVYRELGSCGTSSNYYWIRKMSTETNVAEKVKDVLKYGLQKYGKANSWKFVDNAQNRYLGAYLRHREIVMDAARKAIKIPEESIDEESGLPHSLHMLCNMWFLAYFEMMEDMDESK